MIHLITLNPAIDHFINVDELNIGKTNYVNDDYIVFGGKAINVAQVLKNLNQECRLITTTDRTYDKFIKESLNGIDYRLIPVDQVRINTKLAVNQEITELNSQGISLKNHYQEFRNYIAQNIEANDIVLIAGNPHPDDFEFMIELCKLIKEKTTKLLIDSSKLRLEDITNIKPYLIKPNDEELANLLTTTISTQMELEAAATKIREYGVEELAITLGAKGSLFVNDQVVLSVPVLQGEVINTVGAGDSYVAGLIYGLANNLSTVKTIKYATACASASTFSKGLATRSKIEEYFKQVVINDLSK